MDRILSFRGPFHNLPSQPKSALESLAPAILSEDQLSLWPIDRERLIAPS